MSQHGNTPGYDGKYLPGEATVENPYDGELETGCKNFAENPTLEMYNRGLVDGAALAASNEVHRLRLAMSGGSQGVIDPSNEPVDVSQRGKDWTQRQFDAAKKLISLRDSMKARDWLLVVMVAGEQMQPSIVAGWWREVPPEKRITKHDKLETAKDYRSLLESVARAWGYAR